MLKNALQCPWCKQDLRRMKLPQKTSELYYGNVTHLSTALELWNTGYEHEECNCQWTYEGKLIKEGVAELKDKYEVKSLEETNKSNTNELENNKNEEINNLQIHKKTK